MKRRGEAIDENQRKKTKGEILRCEEDQIADQAKFDRITTEGRQILPRYVRKYTGTCYFYRKIWISKFSSKDSKHLRSKSHGTEEEAFARIKSLNVSENLPIDNIMYEHNGDHYCVLTGNLRNQMMKFSIVDLDLVESHIWMAVYSEKAGRYYAKAYHDGHLLSYAQLLFPDMKPGDHFSRDTLDNTRENLRVVSRSIQSTNRRIQSNNTSGVIGVSRDESSMRWCVQWRTDDTRDGVSVNKRQYFNDGVYGGSENAYKAATAARSNGVNSSLTHQIANTPPVLYNELYDYSSRPLK